jgi:hypothetical protein
MTSGRYNICVLIATLILFVGLASGLAQSGQSWPSGVPDIMKLVQANVGDSTIIAYIRNTGRQYKLNAGEIVMLKQQGFSDPVLTAMLENQPNVAQPQPAPPPMRVSSPPPPPRAYNPYYNPFCYFPPIALSFGWHSGGNYWGAAWHGGW